MWNSNLGFFFALTLTTWILIVGMMSELEIPQDVTARHTTLEQFQTEQQWVQQSHGQSWFLPPGQFLSPHTPICLAQVHRFMFFNWNSVFAHHQAISITLQEFLFILIFANLSFLTSICCILNKLIPQLPTFPFISLNPSNTIHVNNIIVCFKR